LHIPEKVIDLIITNQFTSAFQATSTHNSIELSGFGKLIFNQNKAAKQMEKYLAQKTLFEEALLTGIFPKSKRDTQMKLNTTIKNIDHLKPKLKTNEPKANIRGVEKPSTP